MKTHDDGSARLRARTWTGRSLLLGLVVVLCGCGKVFEFKTEVKGEAVIPGNNSLIPQLLQALPAIQSFTDMDFSQNQDFQNQGVSKDEVKSVRVDEVTIRIVSPSDVGFDFLDELVFTAQTDESETRIAERIGIRELGLDAPNPTLTLDIREDEIQEYVTAPSMNIGVSGKGRQPEADTQLEATVKMTVGWQPL